MCGRYVLKASTLDLQREFHLDQVPQWSARYNIAPLQAAPVILDAAPRALTLAQWGLLPAWARDAHLAHQLINARSETLASKAVFRDARRCLVPCDGFYEWRHEGRARLPHWVHPKDGALLAMAGLWSHWTSPDGLELDTFCVVTTAATEALRSLHERMPVFLDDAARTDWLAGATDLSRVSPWPHPLEVTPVSTHVNRVGVDDPQCLAPPATEQLRLL